MMTSHVTRLLLAQHVLLTNIRADDSGCFVDLRAPSMTRLLFQYTCVD